jgi:hypothetical protein
MSSQSKKVCFLNCGYHRGTFSLVICDLQGIKFFEKIQILNVYDPKIDFIIPKTYSKLSPDLRNCFSSDVADIIRIFTSPYEYIIMPNERKCRWLSFGMPELSLKFWPATKFGFDPTTARTVTFTACGCSEHQLNASVCDCPLFEICRIVSWFQHRFNNVSLFYYHHYHLFISYMLF